MKRIVCLLMSLVCALSFTACKPQDSLKSVVLTGYVVVNDLIGKVRPIQQDPSQVLTGVDIMVGAAKAVNAALGILVKNTDSPFVKQAYDVSGDVLEILKQIQADPSQVTDKIDVLLNDLEIVRDGFVSVNGTLNLGIDFPAPKAVNDDLLSSDTRNLEMSIDKYNASN